MRALMADDKGITTNKNKAKYLIVVKMYSDTAFERVDYHFAGTIKQKVTFRDSTLTVLNGYYADFNDKGYISSEGQYQQNKKEGSWYLYDDTAHAQFEYKYYKDSLLTIINLDSLSKENKNIKTDTTGEKEAYYKDGESAFMKLITGNLDMNYLTENLNHGGNTRVRFVINTKGRPEDIRLIKSSEYALDEEVLRVINLSKDWVPAFQGGKLVKAYRIQPITFRLQE